MPVPHLKLYGVPLSQPFRTVAWALLQRRVPFQIQLCVPGRNDKIGSQYPDYIQKSRGKVSTVPLLEVTEEQTSSPHFTIVESPAILTYLCQRFGWEDWYPTHPNNVQLKTTIDSYMHWHHGGTRRLNLLAKPYLRPEIARDEFDDAQIREHVDEALESLEHGWLAVDDENNNNYIAGSTMTIADLLAYEEIAQASLTGLLPAASNSKEFPNLSRWVTRMQKVPYHGEAHAALTTLGDLTKHNDTPIMKRLGAATKAGLKNLQEAMPVDASSSL